MSDCIFCKIAEGSIPAEQVFASDDVVAFNDVNPVAPVHVLVIPKRHIATINDADPADQGLLGELFLAAKKIAADQGISDAGYRTVVNCGAGAGQSVFHIHLHVIGGRPLSWPPG